MSAPNRQPDVSQSPTGERIDAEPAERTEASPQAGQDANPVDKYDRLRAELKRLWSEPSKDMQAIDKVMSQLDEAHADFKAMHGGRDHQRF